MGAVIQLIGAVVLCFIMCALDGLIVFLPIAAAVGFLAWLFGAPSPRDIALPAGAIVGGLWWVGQFLMKVGAAISAMRAELQKRRIERL